MPADAAARKATACTTTNSLHNCPPKKCKATEHAAFIPSTTELQGPLDRGRGEGEGQQPGHNGPPSPPRCPQIPCACSALPSPSLPPIRHRTPPHRWGTPPHLPHPPHQPLPGRQGGLSLGVSLTCVNLPCSCVSPPRSSPRYSKEPIVPPQLPVAAPAYQAVPLPPVGPSSIELAGQWGRRVGRALELQEGSGRKHSACKQGRGPLRWAGPRGR